MYSLIIPIYKNEESIRELVKTIGKLDIKLDGKLEAVFVIDGSPDQSFTILNELLPQQKFASQLILLSRNFGSFTAVRAGLAEGRGPFFAVMAADLQEPPELIIKFFRSLESEDIDITIGVREGRSDPFLSKVYSGIFWFLYRKLVQPEMPSGGVDIFGCNSTVRDHLLALNEANTSLVGLLFWLGFRRKFVGYQRITRQHGKSAWTFKKRTNYLVNSTLAFSDLPIWMLTIIGGLGLLVSFFLGLAVIIYRIFTAAPVPGYAATILVILTFGTLNCFGLGIIGAYVWRIFENTKGRPQGIILSTKEFGRR